jgi:hypothetical protein
MAHTPIRPALAVVLAITIAGTHPAMAAVHTVTVAADGTFQPKYLEIQSGDTVEWTGLGRTDAIARIAAGGLPLDPADVCFATNALDPAYANPHRAPFEGRLNEFTGPERRGLSGIWALGPEGRSVSLIEIPSPEAEAITPGITAATGCGALDHPENDVLLYDDPLQPLVPTRQIRHRYRLGEFNSGETGSIDGNATDPGGALHVLCEGLTLECDGSGRHCETIEPDPALPLTLPPGTYLNGLLASTYANPDVTGVVLRFNWNDLQYDAAGVVQERWEHLDRELERAIAHGKLVTLDVRAGMFGTPDWIFADYLDAMSGHAAPWCTSPGCAFTSAHPSAGLVQAIEFVDHYDEEPPGDGCGSPVRIGAPGDEHYRALYKDFVSRLAAHVASDTRWFQAVAHVKVSGANLRTSEAELPHHCGDEYTNTADHQVDPKATYANRAGDRVLDVFKTLDGDLRKTAACVCNTQIWFENDYTPQQLYDYYAEVENQIVTSFFGRKSLGYQLMQAGFPRADAARPGGSFFGDHLYREDLVVSSMWVNPPLPDRGTEVSVNFGYEHEDGCAFSSIGAVTGLPELFENRTNGVTEYCSFDTATWPGGVANHVFLGVIPLLPHASFGGLAAYADANGDRFPGSSEQSVTVLDEGGNGRFGDPTSRTHTDRIAGKLFVPQHSGLQPLAQERLDLGYAPAGSDPCQQQRDPVDALAAGLSAAVGSFVADFPIPATDPVSTLSEANGCPNHWIVDQGRDQDSVTLTISLPPWLPPFDVDITFPPQLTGYQTSNKVRSIPHVESALFNLAYNTNAVFVELYEDAIWRIAVSRGTGPSAAPLDDPLDPRRAAGAPHEVCDQAGDTALCYSKNLSQWAEELHLRRATAAALWANLGGLAYPALAEPFPTTHEARFVNQTTSPKLYPYINPNHCDPALVDLGDKLNGLPSALGVIKVLP